MQYRVELIQGNSNEVLLGGKADVSFDLRQAGELLYGSEINRLAMCVYIYIPGLFISLGFPLGPHTAVVLQSSHPVTNA